MQKRFLNVGGNNKAIATQPFFEGWEHHLLDIDPKGKPDLLCDARELTTLPGATYDAVYCSHNLEHYYAHDVPRVLAGFHHVLKPDGFAHIRVPDLPAVFEALRQRNVDVDEPLYDSSAGPMSALDVIYGWRKQIAASGVDFYAHKTGFSRKSLITTLQRAGFAHVFVGQGFLEVSALAFKQPPIDEYKKLLGL